MHLVMCAGTVPPFQTSRQARQIQTTCPDPDGFNYVFLLHCTFSQYRAATRRGWEADKEKGRAQNVVGEELDAGRVWRNAGAVPVRVFDVCVCV